jgi:hypothetical protein
LNNLWIFRQTIQELGHNIPSEGLKAGVEKGIGFTLKNFISFDFMVIIPIKRKVGPLSMQKLSFEKKGPKTEKAENSNRKYFLHGLSGGKRNSWLQVTKSNAFPETRKSGPGDLFAGHWENRNLIRTPFRGGLELLIHI